MWTSRAVIAVLITLAGYPSSLVAQERRLPFGDGGWELTGDAERAAVDGRDAFRIRTGFAIRRDVSLEDGTIDLEVKLTRHRSFAYVLFRMAADGEHEEIYLRPHKSSLPDAVQYNPVYQGRGQWQIYHGPGGTAAVEFTPERWTHVRLVLQGSQGALFIGDTTAPALLMSRLVRSPAAGYLALRSFLPGGQPAGVYPAAFANVRVRPGYVPFDFSSAGTPTLPATPGLITRWRVSGAFTPDPGTVLAVPDAVSAGPWSEVATDDVGRALLISAVRLPPGARRVAAAARVAIEADVATTRRFDFGYSDEVSVFLNGRLLFAADDSYRYDEPRREGLLGLDQATLFLPLQAGRNELVLVVSDGFGGWAVMGRLPDQAGIRVTAR